MAQSDFIITNKELVTKLKVQRIRKISGVQLSSNTIDKTRSDLSSRPMNSTKAILIQIAITHLLHCI